jgi:hypothetical protein
VISIVFFETNRIVFVTIGQGRQLAVSSGEVTRRVSVQVVAPPIARQISKLSKNIELY